MRTVRIEGAGVVAFPESVSEQEVSQALAAAKQQRELRILPKKTRRIGCTSACQMDGAFLSTRKMFLEAHKRDLAAGGNGLEVIKRIA